MGSGMGGRYYYCPFPPSTAPERAQTFSPLGLAWRRDPLQAACTEDGDGSSLELARLAVGGQGWVGSWARFTQALPAARSAARRCASWIADTSIPRTCACRPGTGDGDTDGAGWKRNSTSTSTSSTATCSVQRAAQQQQQQQQTAKTTLPGLAGVRRMTWGPLAALHGVCCGPDSLLAR